MSAIGQVNDFMSDSRWYVDPTDPEGLYESVTNIIGSCTPKPWLTAWSAKLAAEYAVDHYDEVGIVLAGSGRPAAVDLIKGSAKRMRELKAEIGTHQHDVVESLVLDVALPELPEHLQDVEIEGERVDHDVITDGFLQFCEDHDPRFELAEATVANTDFHYAGTLDLVASFPRMIVPHRPTGRRGCLDVKSGKVLDIGMAAQLAAYRRATVVWVNDQGVKAPMPETDFGAILHLRPEYEHGYKLFEVPSDDDAFEWFLQMTRAFHATKAQGPKLKARALYPPLADGSQPPPMLEDVTLKCRGALITAGVRTLADLAGMTRPAVAGIKGVGPKALEDIAQLLAAHSLTLKDEAA